MFRKTSLNMTRVMSAASIVFPAGITPSITQAQSTTGVGATMSITAQQGLAGSVGGILKLGGGAGGVPGTQLAGATQIDLGTAVANVSAKCSFLVGGASILDISQTSTGVTRLKGLTSNLALEGGGSILLQPNGANMIQISATQMGFFGVAIVGRQVSGGTLVGLTAGLVALGLFSS